MAYAQQSENAVLFFSTQERFMKLTANSKNGVLGTVKFIYLLMMPKSKNKVASLGDTKKNKL